MSVGLFVVVLWWGGGWLRADVYAACSVCVGGLSWGDVDSCRDVPQYKVMKYLVFGIISSIVYYQLEIKGQTR